MQTHVQRNNLKMALFKTKDGKVTERYSEKNGRT